MSVTVVRRGRLLLPLAMALWVAGLALAAMLDRSVAQRVHDAGWDDKSRWSRAHERAAAWAKAPGHFLYGAAPVAVAVGLLHRQRARAAALVVLSAAGVGASYVFLKWAAGRRRPVKGIDPFAFAPFQGGWRGISAPNLSFPSGHTMLAFATATSLLLLLTRRRPAWAMLFYAVACVTAAERVLENAHYLSDVVAGAGIGVLTALGARWVLESRRPGRTQPAAPVSDPEVSGGRASTPGTPVPIETR